MVVLASDTLTAPLLPRNIRFLPRKISTYSTTNRNHNVANNWSTKTKIIFAVCVVVVILLVFALALFLQCRRRRRNRNRSSMEAIAENQGYGRGFVGPGMVRKLTTPMDDTEKGRDAAAAEGPDGERYSGQSTRPGMGIYGQHGGVGGEEKFENVPLEGEGDGHVPPRRPGDIYRYGDRKSRFSP